MALKKMMTLACAVAGAVSFTNQANAAVQILDFEGFDYDVVPGAVGTFTTYGGLNWENGSPTLPGWINVNSAANCNNPCGFVAGLTSGQQVATQIHGLTSTISRADPFKAISVQLSSAWRNDEQVIFTGFLSGSQVWSSSYLLSVIGPGANAPTLVNFDSGLIDELRVFSTGGVLQNLGGSSAGAVLDDFNYDDMVSGAVPEAETAKVAD